MSFISDIMDQYNRQLISFAEKNSFCDLVAVSLSVLTTIAVMMYFIAVCFFAAWTVCIFVGLCIATSLSKFLILGLIIFMLFGNLIVLISAYRNYKREQKCRDTQT